MPDKKHEICKYYLSTKPQDLEFLSGIASKKIALGVLNPVRPFALVMTLSRPIMIHHVTWSPWKKPQMIQIHKIRPTTDLL